MLFMLALSAVGTVAGIMCNGNAPLNDLAGVQLNCGRGPQGAACPAGSSCEIGLGDAYAVCCPSLPTLPPALAKCASGVPMADTNGVELFCGRGPNRVDCPLGSQCVTDPADSFAVCCPQNSVFGSSNSGSGFGTSVVVSSNCPPGTSPVNCIVNPCTYATCGVPGATCAANYCGGCHAMWYEPGGALITECGTGPCPPMQSCANSGANCHYEKPPTDSNGCVIGCGTLICDFRNPALSKPGKGSNGKFGMPRQRVILPG